MYLDAEVLGGKKLVEAAVIEGKSSKETDTNFAELIEKWDLVHASFPNETVLDYMMKITNKRYQAYSSLYNFQTHIYNESKPMWEPSKKYKELKKDILEKWKDCFEKKLGPSDRMNVSR